METDLFMICPACVTAGQWLTMARQSGDVREVCLQQAVHAHTFCEGKKSTTWCDCHCVVPTVEDLNLLDEFARQQEATQKELVEAEA